MTIKEELIEYANNCLNDVCVGEYENYLSCIKHKWACQRFLDDLQKIECKNTLATPFPYYWDEYEANQIVKWFTYLRHSKGELSGKPIDLTIWQKFFICQIYGFRKEDNKRRRFKKSFTECARKQAKSQMESGIALYELACGSTRNNEVYEICCAGIKRKQSKVVFEEAKLMLKNSPLQGKFKCTRDYILHIKTGSTMIPLSKEDGDKNDGGNMALFILDEYHQHPTDNFYSMASYGQNTKESLLMIITTAGEDLNSPCYTQEYKYCSQILDPNVIEVVNDTYYVDILEVEANDDIDNELNWWKANPLRMSYKEGQEKIREEYEIAKQIPEKMPKFKTKCLDIWVQAKAKSYMDMAKWRICEVKEIPYDLNSRDVFIGLDMSAKIDLTSVAFIIPVWDKDKNNKDVMKYVCYSHSFIPNTQKLMERMAQDKVPYDSWEEQGFLDVLDEDIIDQNKVIDYVLKTCKDNNWKIRKWCFDPTNASKMMLDIKALGYEPIEVNQSHKSLNETTAGYREQVYCKNILYLYNPLLNFSMSNAILKSNNGLIKIDKDATAKRIDPIDAMLCAYKLAYYTEFEPKPVALTEDYIKSFYNN